MSLLAELAALAPSNESTKNTGLPPTNGHQRRDGTRLSRLNVPAYLRDHGVEFAVKESPGRVIYKVLCRFDASHGSNGETAVIQSDNGLVTYECKHNSCQGRQWRDFRDAIGAPAPDHYDPPLTSNGKPQQVTGGQPAEADPPPEPPRFTASLLSSAEFDATAYRQEFLIEQILVAGQPCVGGGRPKTLKTTLIGIDMAISLGSGTPFLGHFASKPCRVAFWSGEAGAPTIQAKARRVAESHGVRLPDCNVLWSFDLPKLGRLDHVDAMAELIQKHSLDVVIVDPLYLSLLEADENGKPSDLFFMGSKLLPLSELGQATGCTIVLLHHFRKSGNGDGEEVALEELSQSGVAEWARQWLLLARRSPYQHDGHHEVWLRCGGSAGHAGLYGVDVDEGTIDEHFDGRRWDVAVVPGHAVVQAKREDKKQAKADKQREENEEGQKAIVEVMSRLPKGEGVFPTKLRAKTGMSPQRLARITELLLAEKIIEPCEALRSPTHKLPQLGAYRLTGEWWKDQ